MRVSLSLGLSVALYGAPFALAQSYPLKPVRIVVPYAAGEIGRAHV